MGEFSPSAPVPMWPDKQPELHAELLCSALLSVVLGQAAEGPSHLMLCFVFQPKERGSTRVHALNNVNRVLQVLHQNNVSRSGDLGPLGCHRDYLLLKPATCSVHGPQLLYGNVFLMRTFPTPEKE